MEGVIHRIEEIAKTGAFGEGELIEIVKAPKDDVGAQFMSSVYFLSVHLKTVDGQVKKLPIFVKVQAEPTTEFDRDSDGQFFTEVTMYQSVLPDLGAIEMGLCPKMYHGVATAGSNIKEDIVVLEDLLASGYSIVNSVFPNSEHVVFAMKKLGELHGLSYKMKHEFPEKILSYKLLCKRQGDMNEGSTAACLCRGFKYFLDNFPENEIVKKALKKISSLDMNTTWETMREPEEPFAVIIHGDYTSSNVMYSYDTSGKIADMKIFDFGTSIYSDPAVDISIFLYLNTSKEFWAAHWDDALSAYWDGVTSITKPTFSYEEFLKNFAKRAIWGYLPCSFYKPFLMFPELVSKGPTEGTEEDKRNWFVELGGEKGTEALTDIVRHLLERGYLEEFVSNFDLL